MALDPTPKMGKKTERKFFMLPRRTAEDLAWLHDEKRLGKSMTDILEQLLHIERDSPTKIKDHVIEGPRKVGKHVTFSKAAVAALEEIQERSGLNQTEILIALIEKEKREQLARDKRRKA